MAYPTLNKDERNAQFLLQQQELGVLPESVNYLEDDILPAKKFLLVCEGANTEKYYFEAFPVATKTVEVLGGYGGSKMYLVDKAKAFADDEKYAGYEVWCVFDFDVKYGHPNQKQDYDNAIAEALRVGFRVAFSNDCFELWFLLHDRLINGQHHRTEYYEMLTDLWRAHLNNHSYESSGKEASACEGLYKRLESSQSQAINFAKRLHSQQAAGIPYHQMNPCTTVYELVEELNKYLKK